MGPKDISEIGKKLVKQTRPTKDFLVKTLGEAAKVLSEQKQNPGVEPAIKPITTYIFEHGLLQHKDKDIKHLVAICLTEIIRILAPEPPFSDHDFREVFQLILSTFAELADTRSPFFCKRVKILETVKELKCCLLMLDIGCEDLVVEMFKIFFSVVRETHHHSLLEAIKSIMELILKENVAQLLLNVILRNLLKEGKGGRHPSSRLAEDILKACSDFIMPPLCVFLTTCVLDRDSVQSELKEFHHDIILKVYQCAPQILLSVIPVLSQELLADQVDIRRKAVSLIGKLLSLPQSRIAQDYNQLFSEFLKKFSDISTEVRVSSVQCVKACYLSKPYGPESTALLRALSDRLLDLDDSVRSHAVAAICDMAISDLKSFPEELISEATKRLRDKKISVRKKTLQKLLELYKEYCMKFSDPLLMSDRMEQIPCRILKLCFEKDCKEFRPQNMELLLSNELFPDSLSVEVKTRHWIKMFSLFDPLHVEALNTILLQKARFQKEMLSFVSFQKKKKAVLLEESSIDKDSVAKLASLFWDPARAQECLHMLHQTESGEICDALRSLLEDYDLTKAQFAREKFLKMIGKHPHYEIFQSMSTRCQYNIFSSKSVASILDHVNRGSYVDEHEKDSCINLLCVIINSSPVLLSGSEIKFQTLLLEDDNIFNVKLIQALAKAGTQIFIKLSDIYPSLVGVSVEGTRAQSKVAVFAIAALISPSEESVFSELARTLVDSLKAGKNTSTILQALGCLAQHSISTFETCRAEVTAYIEDYIFQKNVEFSDDISLQEDMAQPSNNCKLKIQALKTLVKSFMPHTRSDIKLDIGGLLDVVFNMLQTNSATLLDFSDDRSKFEMAHMRLAAGKAVLRLSRRWDSCIPTHIFEATILLVKDSSPIVRKSFIEKTHKLLLRHVLPGRYACAFALAVPAYLTDLQDDICDYLAEYIRERSRETHRNQKSFEQGSVVDDPAYVVVFLISLIAHSTSFPPKDCFDVDLLAQHFSPLFFILLALVNEKVLDGDKDRVDDVVSSLLCIFRAIKKAEDSVDASITYRLHILAETGILAVNAIYHSKVSGLRAKRMVLLPSSTYRVNSNFLHKTSLPEGFLWNVLQTFKSQITMPPAASLKHGRKRQEDALKLDSVKYNILSLVSQMQVKQLMDTTKEVNNSKVNDKALERHAKKQFNVKEGIRKTVCTPAHGLETALDSHATDERNHGVSECLKPLASEERQLSSCSSITTKQLKQSTKKSVTQLANALMPDGRKSGHSTITAESCEYKLPCSLKSVANQGIDYTVDNSMDEFETQSNYHKGILALGCPPAVPGDHQNQSALKSKIPKVGALENATTKKRKNPECILGAISSSRLIPLPGALKEAKDQNVSTGTSTNDVLADSCIGKRTRRRKT